MASTTCLPQQYKIDTLTEGCVTTNGGVTTDYVSLKNAHKAWLVCTFDQAVGNATTVQPMMATAVAPTGATAITTAQEWWLNVDTSAATGTDTLVKQTAGTIGTCDAGAVPQLMIFEIDPAKFGGAYDCLGVVVSNSGQATNFVAINIFIEERYKQATPPTAITD